MQQNSEINNCNTIENDFEIINHHLENFEVLDTINNYDKQSFNDKHKTTKYQTIKSSLKTILNGSENNDNEAIKTSLSSSSITRIFNKNQMAAELPEIILTSFDNQSTNEIESNVNVTDEPLNQNVKRNLMYQNVDSSISDLNLDRKLSVASSTVSSIRSRNSSLTAFSIKRNLAMADIQHAEKKIPTLTKPNPSTVIHLSELSSSLIDNNQSSIVPTVGKESVDQHFPNYLKCQICHKLFKDPRTLNCLHSFCFDCLINENYGQDSSIPFWSHSDHKNLDWKNSQVNFDQSMKSTTSFTSVGQDLESLTQTQSRPESRSSFSSYKSRKSIDKQLLKERPTSKNLVLSLASTEKTKFIICSICQHCTEMPIGGIRQIPKNFIIVRKIDEILLNIGNEMIVNIWCGLCFDEMPAAFHCLTCIINLCNFCKEAHERQKSTSNHQIQSLFDLRKLRKREKSSNDVAKVSIKCSMHPAFELKLFCNNCQQIICSDCSILLHKGHKYEQGLKVIKNYLKLIKETAEKTKPLCEYTDHSISQLANCSRKINEKCNQIQNDVENFMSGYFEAVEVHQRTLIQQISRARETKMQMILDQQLEMEKRSSDAKAAFEFSQELIETGTYMEILSFVNVLMKRFEFCQKYKPPLDSKISDALHFLSDVRAPSTKAQNNIPLFGIITTQTVEPQFCTLESEGLTQLRVHKKVDLIILSRDADGVPLCHGGLTINAQVKYKESVSRLMEIQIGDKRDGTYSVSFVPEYPGTLALAITINKRHIKDSPFSLIARTLRPHSGIFHCCTFCSSKGSKITVCACEGTMVGYKGCGHGHPGHPGRRHWSCCGSTLENSECVTANQF